MENGTRRNESKWAFFLSFLISSVILLATALPFIVQIDRRQEISVDNPQQVVVYRPVNLFMAIGGDQTAFLFVQLNTSEGTVYIMQLPSNYKTYKNTTLRDELQYGSVATLTQTLQAEGFAIDRYIGVTGSNAANIVNMLGGAPYVDESGNQKTVTGTDLKVMAKEENIYVAEILANLVKLTLTSSNLENGEHIVKEFFNHVKTNLTFVDYIKLKPQLIVIGKAGVKTKVLDGAEADYFRGS